MKATNAQDERVQTIDPQRRHLIFPANQPEFKPRKLIIPPVGIPVAREAREEDDDTLAS